MGEGFMTGVAVGASAVLVLLALVFGGFLIIRPWLRMLTSGGRGSLLGIVGMRLRGTPVNLVIDAYTSLIHRGEKVSLRHVESVYIAQRANIMEARDLIDHMTEELRRQDTAN